MQIGKIMGQPVKGQSMSGILQAWPSARLASTRTMLRRCSYQSSVTRSRHTSAITAEGRSGAGAGMPDQEAGGSGDGVDDEQLVRLLPFDKVPAIVKYRQACSVLDQVQQERVLAQELYREVDTALAETKAAGANVEDLLNGVRNDLEEEISQQEKRAKARIDAAKKQLPKAYLDQEARMESALRRVAVGELKKTLEIWKADPDSSTFPGPVLVSTISLLCTALLVVPLSWLAGLGTWQFWDWPGGDLFFPTLGQFVMWNVGQFVIWTTPYTGALLLLRLLAGRTWYTDMDGLGPQLPRLSPWEGALLWPATLSLAEGILWRGLVLSIIIGIVKDWVPKVSVLDPLSEEEAIRASLGGLTAVVALPPQFFSPLQAALCGIAATGASCLKSDYDLNEMFRSSRDPALEEIPYASGTMMTSIRVLWVQFLIQTWTLQQVDGLLDLRLRVETERLRNNRGAAATAGGTALSCMFPEWLRDNRAAAPKEYFELWNEARTNAVDPPSGSILEWLYPVFIFLDTGYLAWETLATKSLPLSIVTQAVALAALYAAERVSAARKP